MYVHIQPVGLTFALALQRFSFFGLGRGMDIYQSQEKSESGFSVELNCDDGGKSGLENNKLARLRKGNFVVVACLKGEGSIICCILFCENVVHTI